MQVTQYIYLSRFIHFVLTSSSPLWIWAGVVLCHTVGKIILLGIISKVCSAEMSGKTDRTVTCDEETQPPLLSVKRASLTVCSCSQWLPLMTVPLPFRGGMEGGVTFWAVTVLGTTTKLKKRNSFFWKSHWHDWLYAQVVSGYSALSRGVAFLAVTIFGTITTNQPVQKRVGSRSRASGRHPWLCCRKLPLMTLLSSF